MKFKPTVWRPIALALGALNLVAVGFAAAAAEGWHAAAHVAVAAAFGLWAERLRRQPGGDDLTARLEALELEMSDLRRELAEAQERLDFAERVLARGSRDPEGR